MFAMSYIIGKLKNAKYAIKLCNNIYEWKFSRELLVQNMTDFWKL